jgi:hypothetical protein
LWISNVLFIYSNVIYAAQIMSVTLADTYIYALMNEVIGCRRTYGWTEQRGRKKHWEELQGVEKMSGNVWVFTLWNVTY